MSRTKILAAFMAATLMPLSGVAAELALPFRDSFLPADRIGLFDENPRWTVVDNNNDGYMYTWSNYNAAGMGGTFGYVECMSHYLHGSDDYLVSYPIHIEAGTVHLSFYYRASSESEPEAFDVLFGKAGDVASLPVIKSVDNVINSDWELLFVDIDVPETGDYNLAIHARSTSAGHMLRIDEIEMDYGKYQARPDMAVITADLPLHGDAFQEPVGLKLTVTNRGGAVADGFDAAYSVNDGAWVSQHFTDKVEPGQTLTVVFDEKASFATPDTRYDVRFKAEAADDMWAFNNECAGVVRNVTSRTLPYEIKFADVDRESLDLFWWPSDFEQSSWKLSDRSVYKPSVLSGLPLVSGGLTLEPGEYKFALNAMAGSWGWPENETCDYVVKMGVTGTDIAGWQTVVERKALYTNDVVQNIEDRITVTEAGNYSFALMVTRNSNTFNLNGVSVDYANTDDVAVEYGCAWPMGEYIPAKMLSAVSVPVTVRNIGRNVETVTLTAEIGGQAVSDPVEVEVGVEESKTVNLPVKLGDVKAGDEITVSVSAGLAAEDATPENNSFDVKLTVTDEVLSRDNITDFTNPFGTDNTDFRCGYGSAFHLTGAAVLSGIDLVLAESESETTPFVLNVYHIENGNIGRLLHVNELERTKEAGVKRFALTPLRLDAGDYFFELVQNRGAAIGICREAVENGSYQTRSQWFLNPDLFDPDEIRSTEGYNLGIRPVFADGAEAPAVNLQAVKFLAPLTEDLMLTAEPVSVVYNSLGYDRLENVQFNCLVDGVPAATTTVDVIEPYQLNFKVDFTVDLTALGEHTITVEPSVNGDSDTSDNAITLTVNSIAEADQYHLDFESCHDFATRFNPSWLSVDGDGVPTNGLMIGGFQITWPGWDEPFGFVAYNPDETVPLAPGLFEGYSGKRFGASFFTGTGVPNDDWLISPALPLGNKPVMKFRCKSQTVKYGMEEYYVLVSPEGSDRLEDFIPVGDKRSASDEWEDITIDLSAYANTTPRVAVHCVSQDKMVFLIDDIEIVPDESDSLSEVKAAAASTGWDSATGTLYVITSEADSVERIEVYGVSGMMAAGFDTEGSNVSVDLSDLVAGTYICRIVLSDGTTSSVKIAVR